MIHRRNESKTRTGKKSNRRTFRLDTANPRSGSALLAVVVIVAMLSLSAYTYSELMLSEYAAAQHAARIAESQQLADSGMDYAAVYVGLRGTEDQPNLYHSPSLFHQIEVIPETATRPGGYFSIVAPVEGDETFQQIRYGLRNESAKININAIAASSLSETDAENYLLMLPNMTVEVADAILDWIDADDSPRTFGAESTYYLALSPPREAKNGPLDSLDELLDVEGVTPELLYGEDGNRNGLLDPNEQDGSVTAPDDNGDSVLDFGWAEYLTVNSQESNLRADGSEKIPLNSNDLASLYDQIAAEFDDNAAAFVIAYRIFGPSNRTDPETPEGIFGSGSSNLSSSDQQALQQVSQGIANALVGNNDGTVTRAGMDLSAGGNNEINSIFDLVDAQVSATIESASKTLYSPWTSDGGAMQKYLPGLMDAFGIVTDTSIEGRIDINGARYETLMGIPSMTQDIAQSIVASKAIASGGGQMDSVYQSHSTNGWLMIEGIVDLPTMRQLDPYITTKGDIFQAQIVGYFISHSSGSGTAVNTAISSRINVMIDGSETPAEIISYSDYSELGVGYPIREWQQSGQGGR